MYVGAYACGYVDMYNESNLANFDFACLDIGVIAISIVMPYAFLIFAFASAYIFAFAAAYIPRLLEEGLS